ncbi:MAG: FtsW/RodA/SpoVE family cell cycle protein [Blautia sp.]|nr:FtsW/RodA/SpoVE family cell cycle protein [Blautia sp.]
MVNLIVEFSKYAILTLMVLYTLSCVYLVEKPVGRQSRFWNWGQFFLVICMYSISFLVIALKTRDYGVVVLYVEMLVLFLALQISYRLIYPQASVALLNTTCMLLGLGFTMLCRLDIVSASRQLLIAAGASVLALAVPLMIRRMRFLKKLAAVYAAAGILLLGAVLMLAQTSYGAKLSLMGIQPSEAIKITFVFFLASVLWRTPSLGKVAAATIVAALHVGILVLSRDLGSALIFFVTYLALIYVSTRKPVLLGVGAAGGAVAAVCAYHLFHHVKERVSAFVDPLAVYENEGYQIVQSLFAIGTGGWFGMGLCQGSPEVIPVVKNDFIFSAIYEELGGIFAICLICVCVCFFLLIVNISLQIKNPFYKLVALGLGIEYALQVFLTIGGAIKFIPMTGVTLPLVSYGGSSLVCSLLMIAIVQGLYIYREDEDEEIERLRREAAFRQKHPIQAALRQKTKR